MHTEMAPDSLQGLLEGLTWSTRRAGGQDPRSDVAVERTDPSRCTKTKKESRREVTRRGDCARRLSRRAGASYSLPLYSSRSRGKPWPPGDHLLINMTYKDRGWPRLVECIKYGDHGVS